MTTDAVTIRLSGIKHDWHKFRFPLMASPNCKGGETIIRLIAHI
jgi:hypothetical protein